MFHVRKGFTNTLNVTFTEGSTTVDLGQLNDSGCEILAVQLLSAVYDPSF